MEFSVVFSGLVSGEESKSRLPQQIAISSTLPKPNITIAISKKQQKDNGEEVEGRVVMVMVKRRRRGLYGVLISTSRIIIGRFVSYGHHRFFKIELYF